MNKTQTKVINKLLDRAREFGFSDASFSLYDCSDSMHDIESHIEAGNELAELVGVESFCEYIQRIPEAMAQYIEGYASAVDDLDDLPEDLNDGRAIGLHIDLTEEEQARIRALVAA